MLKILVPFGIGSKFKKFNPVLYKKIENVVYSNFWDVIVVKEGKDFTKAKSFSNFGTLFINVGPDRIEDAFNLQVDEAVKALYLIEKVVKERQQTNKIKRAKELMMEPILLDPLMAQAYHEFSQNALSRLSIVISEDGLLEEWILWTLLENHETIDFSVASKEEMMLRIFGSKNHPPLLSREGVLVLMNCDKCSEHVSFKIARAATLGFFSPYLSDSKEKCLSRVIFHFENERKVPPYLRQLAGTAISKIPPLRNIGDSLPTILRFFVAFLGQEMTNVNTEISDDIENRVKVSKWSGNWKEFLNFCKSFAVGKEKIQPNTNSLKSLPKLKDYVKDVSAEAEKELIKKAIELYGLNRGKLSRILDINPKTLTKKLKLYGLDDKK